MKKSDEEIIHQVLDGQVDAFSELVEKYQSAVYALAFHITKNFEDARDLAQEAFLKSYAHLETLRDKSKFAPWLRKITRSICLNWLKDREKEQDLSLLPSRPIRTPDQELEAKLMREQILAALHKLSEPNQLTVTLYYMDGLTYQEIANFQSVPVSTVRSRLYESRKRLRKELVTMMDTNLKSEAPGKEFTRQVMEILGVVTEAHTGKPISGARVKTRRIGEATTNADGVFCIENPKGYLGEENIRVEAPGYVARFIPIVLSEEESVEGLDIQLERGASLVGRVVDADGNPVAGAEVSVAIDYGQRTLTDSEGKYTLKGLAPRLNHYSLHVCHESLPSAHSSVKVSGLGTIEVPDIILNRATTVVVGTVKDAEGNPIEGARVYIGGDIGGILDGKETRTNTRGEYRIAGFPEQTSAAVVVYTKEHAPSLREMPTERADFTLNEGKTLAGHIADENGKPIEDVWVNVRWRNYHIDRSTQTDSNGHFRLEHLPEGEIKITVAKYGLVTCNEEITISSESEKTVIPPITMIQKGVIWGKVVDAETGKPIKRFRVKLGSCKKLQEGDIPTPGISSDLTRVGQTFYTRKGEFEIRKFQTGVAASITVLAEGYASFELERAVAKESKTEPLIFKLQKSPSIRGVVLDATTSQPIDGATLFLFDRGQHIPIEPYQGGWQAREIGRTYSDIDGTFTINEAGTQYLYVSHAEYAPAFVSIRKEGDFITIRLTKGTCIVGKATPGRRVNFGFFLEPFRYAMEVIADANGDFQFKYLPPVGLGSVCDYIQGQYSGERYHAVSNSSASLKLEAGEKLTLNFLKKGDIRLFGRVTDANRNLYDNACIRVKVEGLTEPQEQLEHSGGAISNEKGSYEIPNLSPGVYKLRANSFGKERLIFNGSIKLSKGQKKVKYDVILAKAPKREPEIRIAKPEYLQMSKINIATSSRVERFSTESAGEAVWVIDDSYEPYDDGKNLDTLVKLSATGEALLKISYFNVFQRTGGAKLIAVDRKTGDCWVCNIGKLMKVSKDSKEITEVNYSGLGSGVAIDEADGSVVALLCKGSKLYGTGVLRFDPKDGRVIQMVEGVGGCSLDINPKDGTIWIVGKNIYKLNSEGETVFSLENVIEFCAEDVSVDPNDGSAWVVELEWPRLLDSQNRLIKVSESGEILKAIKMQYAPSSVSVDAQDGAVWVASKEILKFDRDGNLLKRIETSGFCVRVNPKDGSCWVASKTGVFKYSSSGDLLASNTNFSNDQKWIAVI